MADTRHKNAAWKIEETSPGRVSASDANLAVLMDIRDELQRLNFLLHCHNFTDMPHILRDIRRNTTKRKKKNNASIQR